MATTKPTQFSLGKQDYIHKGSKIYSLVGSPSVDNILENVDSFLPYDVGYVPAGFEHRPDLISNVFYGTPDYWWLILFVNNIADPFEGLNEGDQILIPKL